MRLTTTGKRVGAAIAAASLLLTPYAVQREPQQATASPQAAAHDEWTPVAQTQARNIPKPERFFGFKMGTSGKLAGFDKIKDYLRLVDRNSDRVIYQVAGTTTEGNEYPVVFISSEQNIRNLDRIVEMNRRLSDPKLTAQQARALAAESVPVYMIEGTLHSTEVSNTQALVDIAHRFATEDSDYTRNVLENTVIMMLPSGNPDGQHRVVDYFNRTEGTDYNRVFPDLYQKYVGHDNNRDWFMFTQPEARIRTELEKKYRPVVFHSGHQAGTGSPRIWIPTYDDPLSRDIDPITIESGNALGAQLGRALIAEGKKGVQHDDAYGIFWNADVAGYSSFRGTSLVLHEIASARDLAFPFTSADGKPLGSQDRTMRNVAPYDSDTWTLEQMVDYAKTSFYAGMKSVADNAESWLYNNLYQVARNSLSWTGGPWAYVLPADQRDPYATYELLSILEFGEVEIHQATKDFTAGDQQYAAGSHIIKTRQPLGRWVDQLLKVEPYPNARKCATCPLIMPYSETTDNLGMLLGVDVKAIQDPFTANLKRVTSVVPAKVKMPTRPKNSGAYLVSPNSYGVGKLLAALQSANIPTFRSEGGFSASERTFGPGTVIVPATTEARTVLTRLATDTGVPVYATDTVPQVKGFQLKPNTRVGLIRGANNMPGGWTMWLLEQYGVNFTVVGADDFAGGGLASRYDTIVIADGITKQRIVTGIDATKYPQEFSWARGVGEEGWAQLGTFVRNGGNLVAVGDGADTARELLDLPIRNAAPADRTQFSAPGTLLNNTFDATVPAAWGMPTDWPVWYYNNSAYQVTEGSGARVAASYPTSGEVLASGYAHGQQALAGLANVVSFEVGQGNVTVAAGEITFRSWPRSALPIVYNSIYQGPSVAVNTPQFGS